MKRDSVYAATVFFIVMAILAVLFVVMSSSARHSDEMAASYISQQEEKILRDELINRNVADCVLTRTAYGFKAVELKSGKIYKIKLEAE